RLSRSRPPATAPACSPRVSPTTITQSHQNAESVVIAEGQPRAVELHDARSATLQNLHRLADVHAKLLQTMNLIGPANQLIDPSSLTGCQHLKRKRIGHGDCGERPPWRSLRRELFQRLIAVETESHYAIDTQSRLQ